MSMRVFAAALPTTKASGTCSASSTSLGATLALATVMGLTRSFLFDSLVIETRS